MRAEAVLREIRKHPNGLWLRELARKSNVSAATVCNYIYGYRDRKGRFVKPTLRRYVMLKKYGNRSVTLVFPK